VAAEASILIVGGGHAGLFLGAVAAGIGLPVTVVDPETPAAIAASRADGRTLALLRGSEDIARSLGPWPAIQAIATPIREARVEDSATGARVRYGPSPDGRAFGWGVENIALRRALLDAFLAAAGEGAFVTGRVTGLERGRRSIAVLLADGRRLEASLLIGADGRGSRIRDLAGIGIERWPYPQTAIALVIRHARPHRGAVHERLRPAGPLATLPLSGRRSGVTWVEPTAVADDLRALTADRLTERLAAELGGALGGIGLDGPVVFYPLSAQHARRYVAPRLALVGDAAHGVHPIHAQGFNMGIADIGALAGLLAASHGRRGDPGGADLLIAYERARWWANERRLRLTDGLNRLFSTDFLPARLARAAALRAIDLVPPLKRLAVSQGMHGR
jgi:2-octaprenyl-6-methoxyphenol hydroxylase